MTDTPDWTAKRDAAAEAYTWPRWPKKQDHDRPERYGTLMNYEIAYDVCEAFEAGADFGYAQGQADALTGTAFDQMQACLVERTKVRDELARKYQDMWLERDQLRAEAAQLRESNRQALNEYALAHEHVKKYLAEHDAARAEVERLKAEHAKFCEDAQEKTDADFKVTREYAERWRAMAERLARRLKTLEHWPAFAETLAEFEAMKKKA